MSRVREKALELAIMAIGYGLPVSDREELLRVAEVFCTWMNPPEEPRMALDEEEYPRLQGIEEALPPKPERY